MKLSVFLLILLTATKQVAATDRTHDHDVKDTSSAIGALRGLKRRGRGKKKARHSEAPAPAPAPSTAYHLSAQMGNYPGVEGSFVWGEVTLRFNPDGSMLTKLDVSGLSSDGSGYGAHIHEGTSCDTPSDPGGHYWDTGMFPDDPWKTVFYDTDSNSVSTSGFYINSGYGFEENEGHAFVLHTEGGDRIGCGVLKRMTPIMSMTSDNIEQYPGYAGELKPEGVVQVDFYEDSSLKFAYKMSGLAASCVKCSVHIHAGTTCSDDALVGGHYWDMSELLLDPWVPSYGALYDTDYHGKAEGFFYLFSGYNFEETFGHAIVFHDQDGTRVGCGTLLVK